SVVLFAADITAPRLTSTTSGCQLGDGCCCYATSARRRDGCCGSGLKRFLTLVQVAFLNLLRLIQGLFFQSLVAIQVVFLPCLLAVQGLVLTFVSTFHRLLFRALGFGFVAAYGQSRNAH